MSMVRRTATAAALVSALIVAPTATATASTSYPLAFTEGLGAYPRSSPDFDARTATAVSEGTLIQATCWVDGGQVTNPYDYTSSVWVRDTGGAFWPEAWLDTGSSGVPDGLASCGGEPAASSPAQQPVEPAWEPNCSPGGPWVEGAIAATPTADGVRISLTPTTAARGAWDAGSGWQSTVDMWHAIQACVPDLYGTTADSVWQQLECHQRFSLLTWPDGSYATGSTYDLEAWTDPLMVPNDITYALSRCLGGPDPMSGMRLFAATG